MEIKEGVPREDSWIRGSKTGVSLMCRGKSKETSGCSGMSEGESFSRESESSVGAGSRRPLQGCWLLRSEVGAT